jgi:hypothetical protein
MEMFKILKDIAGWLFLAIIGIITWFFKSIYSEHQKMHNHYNKIKDFDFIKLQREMENIRFEINKVEFESKRYWQDHKTQMETNQSILIERINSIIDNNKNSTNVIKELFHSLEKRIEKLEN